MEEYADMMTQAMYGQHARHIAFNFVLQSPENNKAPFVGITDFANEMGYGFKKTHCLVLCDAIIRPHLVIESNHLRGTGMSGILRDGMSNVRDWVRHGNILVNNLPSRLTDPVDRIKFR